MGTKHDMLLIPLLQATETSHARSSWCVGSRFHTQRSASSFIQSDWIACSADASGTATQTDTKSSAPRDDVSVKIQRQQEKSVHLKMDQSSFLSNGQVACALHVWNHTIAMAIMSYIHSFSVRPKMRPRHRLLTLAPRKRSRQRRRRAKSASGGPWTPREEAQGPIYCWR